MAGVATYSPAMAVEKLRVVAWDGYADGDLVAKFEKQFNVKVELSYVYSDEDLWEKVSNQGGRDYDVFAVNTAELQRYINSQLVTPVNLQLIPNHKFQTSRFKKLEDIPGLVRGNKLYAVPYTYSEMSLIYHRKKVKEIPRSMAAMWDPDYRGRVLAFNTSGHNFSMAALLSGVKNPFDLNPEQLSEAAKKLVALRRNVLTFYASPEEAVELFIQNDVVLLFGNYGMQQVKALRDAGADIGYIFPEEGALAWLDCWAITQGAHNKNMAANWINFMLTKQVGDRLTKAHGLANTISSPQYEVDIGKVLWVQAVEDAAKRKSLWDKIISGDSLDKF